MAPCGGSSVGDGCLAAAGQARCRASLPVASRPQATCSGPAAAQPGRSALGEGNVAVPLILVGAGLDAGSGLGIALQLGALRQVGWQGMGAADEEWPVVTKMKHVSTLPRDRFRSWSGGHAHTGTTHSSGGALAPRALSPQLAACLEALHKVAPGGAGFQRAHAVVWAGRHHVRRHLWWRPLRLLLLLLPPPRRRFLQLRGLRKPVDFLHPGHHRWRRGGVRGAGGGWMVNIRPVFGPEKGGSSPRGARQGVCWDPNCLICLLRTECILISVNKLVTGLLGCCLGDI